MNGIRTRRMLLRPARKDDLDQLHSTFSSAMAMKYWDTLPHSDVAQTAEFIDNMIATPFDQGEDFIVEYNGMVVGKAGFWKFPEIGFIFHPDYWGKGLATEAVSALVEYGFQERNVSAVLAEVDPRNRRSIHLLEKLGFRESRRESNTIKVGDVWCDSAYFVLQAPNAQESDIV